MGSDLKNGFLIMLFLMSNSECPLFVGKITVQKSILFIPRLSILP